MKAGGKQTHLSDNADEGWHPPLHTGCREEPRSTLVLA